MSDSNQIAFIDEYGDPNLNTQIKDVSTHFIVSAVIVEKQNLDAARAVANEIVAKHYPGGELKSSKISKRDNRRLGILQEMQRIPAHYYSVVIDKREICKDSGLIYKQPFLKFLNGLLHRRLFRTFPDLKVVSDEHGRPDFMRGFTEYVKKRHIPDFFMNAEFVFVPSHEEIMIQIADVVAGSIARVYDPKKISEAGRQFLKAMEPQTLCIDEWPPKYGFTINDIEGDPQNTEADSRIREITITQAILFIRKNSASKDEAVQCQVEALKYLLYAFRFLNPSHYTSGKRLIEVLEQFNGAQMSDHYFRSNVIAPLRDQSILIASSSSGYKLPRGREDLLRTVDQFDKMITPMLARLSKAREEVKFGTKGMFDLLGESQHAHIRDVLDALA